MDGKKILIIDDEDYIGDLVVDFLTLENMTGVKSENFTDASEKAIKGSFDLIISDVNIGNESVEAFISFLKKSKVNTPVVLMTGDHRIDKEFTSLTGAVGIIYKPFQVAPFLNKIKEFLERT